MDPWSKWDYSRHIQEASMAMEGLPEVVPPSGRVPGQLLLATPILKTAAVAVHRGDWENNFNIRGFLVGGKYRRRGAVRGSTREPRLGTRHQGAWVPSGGPLAPPRC